MGYSPWADMNHLACMPEASLLSLQGVTFPLSLHGLSSVQALLVYPTFLVRTRVPAGRGPTHMPSFRLNYTFEVLSLNTSY